ncbi:hypothetical protein [Massilia haematophila]|uniref:DUF3108 domain-containing protein n=1 Tax=Massilia haematophila TaxID=457923 RepID=A0ABV7PQC5_9BURK
MNRLPLVAGVAPAWHARSLCAAAALALLALAPARAQPVSPAEVLLFETDHLARVKAPATLVYAFRKVSNVEPAFTDNVQLEVSREKGALHAELHFLSGERKHELPGIDDVHGNPVLLGFLERDIAEMKRLTGGSSGYFRKRIRLALAEGAQVTSQRITYQGKTLDAKAIRIQPYLDDPLHARFEHYVRKTYTFVISDAVPGGIYQLSTSLANASLPGAVVARTAATGAAAPGKAGSGTATSGTATSGTATSGTAKFGTPAAGAARANMAAPAMAMPAAAAAPGMTPPGAALPVIDETLTLVKVAEPKR